MKLLRLRNLGACVSGMKNETPILYSRDEPQRLFLEPLVHTKRREHKNH